MCGFLGAEIYSSCNQGLEYSLWVKFVLNVKAFFLNTVKITFLTAEMAFEFCFFWMIGRPIFRDRSSPTNFYLFQFSHMCKWLHHPTRCLARNLGVFLDTSLFLILTANSSPYPIDSTPFFWNLGTSLAQVLSPSPEPLQELTISFSASSPSLLPLLPPPSLPTPAPPLQSPFSSRQPEQSFEFDRSASFQRPGLCHMLIIDPSHQNVILSGILILKNCGN